jgi:prolyl-tRNA synthetase, family I
MNKYVESITDMDKDFAQWYTDVVKKSEMIDYSSVRGCMILRPYGYAIWELIQKHLDKKFKETGHENVYMPLLIPQSLLQKEKDHVEGFAPEVAWVTYGGDEKLTEKLCIRPTSETLFCEHYANIIQSHRDLPKLYNQWCSVVRWEKTTRPFLRSLEFLWQEGHTAHATFEEAEAETLKMLDVYADFCEKILAIPVIKGKKTENEKFAGALSTYTIESLMHDGRALQSGTSHNFGDGFAKAFDIKYTDSQNQLKYVYQTSWGISTRLIGAIIMVHGDNNGLVLPPNIAPIQIVIIPIAMKKSGVKEKAIELEQKLSKSKIRVKLDLSDKTPGWKFSEYEMKGVPLRIEIGPRDLENNCVTMVRRDTNEKITEQLDNLNIEETLEAIQKNLFDKALAHRNKNTFEAKTLDELEKILSTTPGFIKTNWCGNTECELKVKEKTGASARCIAFEKADEDGKCLCCGEKSKHKIYWAKAY